MSCHDLDDAAAVKVAEPMMDDVIAGLSRRDYALHSRHFSIALKSRITPERFQDQTISREKQWGQAGSRELLSIFRKHKSFTLLWHQSFGGTDDQVVAIATIAVKGGRYFVDEFLLL